MEDSFQLSDLTRKTGDCCRFPPNPRVGFPRVWSDDTGCGCFMAVEPQRIDFARRSRERSMWSRNAEHEELEIDELLSDLTRKPKEPL